MTRRFARAAIALMLCLAVSQVQAAPRGKEGGRSEGGKSAERKPERNEPKNESAKTPSHGNSAPGGDWSERSHHGGQATNQPGGTSGAAGAKELGRKSQNPTASGAQGAAAGAAAANRNAPQTSGAKGAAAGAAAANRKTPPVSGAQGAAAGAAAANRNQPPVSGAAGAAAGAAAVRNSYDNPHLYDQQWYGAHPGVWAPRGWAAGAAWTPATWGAVSSYCGASTTPLAYNYGTNVTYQSGNVMVDGESVGTAAEFSQQAADLAQSGGTTDAATDEWLPLGVFAMVRNEQQHPQLILQLAINKQGILRGNYTDELTEHTQSIQGAVDPKTQRAAWTVGDNATSVMEAGLSNLVHGEAPALIHKNGKTDHWLLVRLDQPNQSKNAAANPAAPQ